ncbi:hypothetical protein EIN_001600 [Entamoeba invadens IP1]|uniref:Leucine rich repeat containing protein BspA family protein n=1 Tax=Entamoeba invadens IP1 TaxID=370355 RepID=L7FJX0_ENTIV|nr:hypothetical protein EIN_001600 [Entamoeba invadens IP1]ELP83559.1 hypothetical protein EIN_001600 [Entamoeba invadens IP1]|eukprot:XP_004182905.1 hypothetical protein EIN_001600 [Entamoeba invadens IP1]
MPSQLDLYSLMIVSKYFKNIGDFIRLIQVCKKFEDIPSMFHYNPICLYSHFNFFSNVETYHYYKKIDKYVPSYIHCIYDYQMSYTEYLKKRTSNSNFTHVTYNIGDYIKYKKYDGATHLKGKAFKDISEDAISLDLSDIISLGDYGLQRMSTLTFVELGNSIQELPISCFDVNLKKFDISHIKTIGEKCFYCCVELSAITLGEVLSVGLSSFYDTFSIKYVKNLGTKNLNTLIN